MRFPESYLFPRNLPEKKLNTIRLSGTALSSAYYSPKMLNRPSSRLFVTLQLERFARRKFAPDEHVLAINEYHATAQNVFELLDRYEQNQAQDLPQKFAEVAAALRAELTKMYPQPGSETIPDPGLLKIIEFHEHIHFLQNIMIKTPDLLDLPEEIIDIFISRQNIPQPIPEQLTLLLQRFYFYAEAHAKAMDILFKPDGERVRLNVLRHIACSLDDLHCLQNTLKQPAIDHTDNPADALRNLVSSQAYRQGSMANFLCEANYSALQIANAEEFLAFQEVVYSRMFLALNNPEYFLETYWNGFCYKLEDLFTQTAEELYAYWQSTKQDPYSI
jgi:hypothetical protein